MKSDLATRLCDHVDSVEPVSLGEVKRAPYVSQPRRQRSRGLLLAGVAAAVVLVAAIALASMPDDAAELDTASEPPTAPATAIDVTTCGAPPESRGCEATPTEAEQALGLPLPTPTGIPDGWELRNEHIRYWPEGYPGEGFATEAVGDYNQAWAPPGEDLTTGTPTYIQLTRRAADVGGFAGDGRDLGPNTIIDDGTWIRLNAPHVDQSTVDRILNELTGPSDGLDGSRPPAD